MPWYKRLPSAQLLYMTEPNFANHKVKLLISLPGLWTTGFRIFPVEVGCRVSQPIVPLLLACPVTTNRVLASSTVT